MRKFVYTISSPKNIRFNHVAAELTLDDFTLSEEEWVGMTEAEKENFLYDSQLIEDIVFGEIEIDVEEIEDADL